MKNKELLVRTCIEEAIKNLSDENVDVSIIDIDLWAYGVGVFIPSFLDVEEQKQFQKTIDKIRNEIKSEKHKTDHFDREKCKELFLKLQKQFNEAIMRNKMILESKQITKPNVDDLEKCFKKNKKDKIKKLKKQISDLSKRIDELNNKVKMFEVELANIRNGSVSDKRFIKPNYIGDYPPHYGQDFFLKEKQTTTTNNYKD